eukprot:4877942-Pyramimonas_sp.AAC.1
MAARHQVLSLLRLLLVLALSWLLASIPKAAASYRAHRLSAETNAIEIPQQFLLIMKISALCALLRRLCVAHRICGRCRHCGVQKIMRAHGGYLYSITKEIFLH